MRIVRLLTAAVLGLVGLVIVAPPASGATQAVLMQSYAFSPSALTVHVGDTVTWTNHDQAPHDVTTTSAPVAIKSSTLSTGQSFSYTFTTAGTYKYYCSIHPDMTAQLVVQPAVAAAPAPAVTTAPKTTQPKSATTSRAPSSEAAGQAPVSSMSMSADPSTAAAPASSVASAQAQPAVAAGVTPTTTTTTTLDPMLLVAGVAAGIAVLCLLILGSRRET
jgi:plastocyanin